MAADESAGAEQPPLFVGVALLADRPEEGLPRGQVGTVVHLLDPPHVLVEFSDNDGRAYAIIPLHPADFLVLNYEKPPGARDDWSTP